MKPEIRRFPDLEALSRAAADAVCAVAQSSVNARGRFALALSGGKTPRRLYELLAERPWRERMPWLQTHMFWSDERCVPKDHPDSSYCLAYAAFLDRVPIPQQNVHSMPVEMHSQQTASEAYEKELKVFFESQKETFDLILLGMGADGHTASLFPGDPALEEEKRWVLAVEGGYGTPPVSRLTLSLPMINSSHEILFLISGEDKKLIMELIAQGVDVPDFPAARVARHHKTLWFWTPR